MTETNIEAKQAGIQKPIIPFGSGNIKIINSHDQFYTGLVAEISFSRPIVC